jgi:hypothetical protein
MGTERFPALEIWRETGTMVLYISVVELAELAALRAANVGVSEDQLIELVWGTAAGLALAHWFAFVLVTDAVRRGRIRRDDLYLGAAQFIAAAAVSLLCSIAIVWSDGSARAAAVVPAIIIAVSGYWISRASGRSQAGAFLVAAIVLAVGLTVAIVKSNLVGH